MPNVTTTPREPILLQTVRDSVLFHCVLSETACQRLEGGERVFGRGPFEPPTQQGSEAVNRLPSVLLFDDIQNVRLEPPICPAAFPTKRSNGCKWSSSRTSTENYTNTCICLPSAQRLIKANARRGKSPGHPVLAYSNVPPAVLRSRDIYDVGWLRLHLSAMIQDNCIIDLLQQSSFLQRLDYLCCSFNERSWTVYSLYRQF